MSASRIRPAYCVLLLILALCACTPAPPGGGSDNDNAATNDNAGANDNTGGGSRSWRQVARLDEPEPFAGDIFGDDVAIEGDILAVAAPGDDLSRGAVHGFARDGDGWTLDATLTPNERAEGADFGVAVAITGGDIIVGASDVTPPGTFFSLAGAAYVFRRVDGAWTQVQELSAPDAANFAGFGDEIAADGDVIVIGDFETNDLEGAAYVFRRRGRGGMWAFEQKLLHDDRQNFDWFGFALDVDGDRIAVGAPVQDSGTGAVYLFERDAGGTWNQAQKLRAETPRETDQFGLSVALEGDTLVVGAPLVDAERGEVYIYELRSGQWTRTRTLRRQEEAEDGVHGHFGWSLALRGDLLAIGAQVTSSTHIYRRGSNGWREEDSVISSEDLLYIDSFGSSTAISDDVIVVGAPFDPIAGYGTGAAYVFELGGNSADQRGAGPVRAATVRKRF